MNFQNSQKLIVVLGPTASGKTGVARRLCQKFNGFIISADSRQVYRYLDIGTGKVDTADELLTLQNQRQELLKNGITNVLDYYLTFEGVRHYMIDFVEPNEEYNVALYQRDVYNNLISNFKFLISNQIPNPKSQNTNYKLQATSYKLPFLVGGTGQYIDAVVDNWQFPEGEPNLELRQKLTEQIKSKGLDSVWNQLMKIDPDCARFVQKENPRRVARALEYVLTTGKKFSAERRKGKRQFEVLKIGIDLPRDELYKKIDERVEARLKLEMIEEVQTLHDKHGLSWERLQNFGLEYRVIADWLCRDSIYAINGVSTTVAQRLKWAIHDYARRQMTWFRRDKEIGWVKDCGEAEKLTAKFFNF